MLWQGRPQASLSRVFSAYQEVLVYGSAGTSNFYLTLPRPDWGVDARSIFSWHFAALAQAMQSQAPVIMRALGVE